jgi:hypothetical protein
VKGLNGTSGYASDAAQSNLEGPEASQSGFGFSAAFSAFPQMPAVSEKPYPDETGKDVAKRKPVIEKQSKKVTSSGPSLAGRLGKAASNFLVSKLLPRKQAHLGAENVAHFDEATKRWIFPGEDQIEDDLVPPPPPDDDVIDGSGDEHGTSEPSFDAGYRGALSVADSIGTFAPPPGMMPAFPDRAESGLKSSAHTTGTGMGSTPATLSGLSAPPATTASGQGGNPYSSRSGPTSSRATSVSQSSTTSTGTYTGNKFRAAGGGRRPGRPAYVDTFNPGASASAPRPMSVGPAPPRISGSQVQIFTPTVVVQDTSPAVAETSAAIVDGTRMSSSPKSEQPREPVPNMATGGAFSSRAPPVASSRRTLRP